MQSWAKRGLRVALVTGGLFLLGSGIASAQGSVDLPGTVGHVTAPVASSVTRTVVAKTQGLPLPVPLPTSMGLPSIEDLGVLDSVLGGGLGGGLPIGGLGGGDTSNLIPVGDLGGVLGGLGGLGGL